MVTKLKSYKVTRFKNLFLLVVFLLALLYNLLTL